MNYKDIVNLFDSIEDVFVLPNGTSIIVKGTKNNDLGDIYVNYKDSTVAKEVVKKISYFIGIKTNIKK